MWGELGLNIFPPIVTPNRKMKEDKTTIVEKNPYKYNGESLHISPQPKALQRIDNQSVTKSKKFYIESSYTT